MKQAAPCTVIWSLAGALLICASTSTVDAQAGLSGSIAARVDAVKTGKVRMSFAARDGVCGDGWNWYRTRSNGISGSFSNYNGGNDVVPSCQNGPVRIVVKREDGATRELRTYVGGTWRADTGVTDLGVVAAADAGRWLLDQAERGDDRIASSAMSAASLSDSVDGTAMLLRIATDDRRSTGVRSSALNWLGEVAGEKVAAKLDSIAYEEGDRELRKQAILTISRRPADEAVPTLIKMAETLPDRELRKTAVFSLARIKDPRAVAWITRVVGEKE